VGQGDKITAFEGAFDSGSIRFAFAHPPALVRCAPHGDHLANGKAASGHLGL
jgi:hypothetical protein